METLPIPNAPHWLNNSIVVVKADYEQADEAYVLNTLVRIDPTSVSVTGKHRDTIRIQRMVQPGSIVSVKRPGGRVKTVHLPQEAEQLLVEDAAYINAQIDRLNEPVMDEAEQQAFPVPVSDSSQAT
jgi:hypothetical protein